MKKIIIGQIGNLHDHSKDIMLTLKRLPEHFDIIGFVPESEDDYFKEYSNYGKNVESFYKGNPLNPNTDPYEGIPKMTIEELLSKNPDAVFIESFEKRLLDYAFLCVERGIHVHIDKPAGIDIDRFRSLLNLAKRKNVIVHFGYMFRYNPAILKAKELIDSGALGSVCSIEASMGTNYAKDKKLWLKNFSGGMMYFLGCHLVDILYMFQGIPEKIYPLNRAVFNDFGAEDYGFTIFQYKNGSSIVKSISSTIPEFNARYIKIACEKGTIKIDPIEEPQDFNMENGFALKTQMEIISCDNPALSQADSLFQSETYDRYAAMLTEFADMVTLGESNKYNYEYELQVQSMVLASAIPEFDYQKNLNL